MRESEKGVSAMRRTVLLTLILLAAGFAASWAEAGEEVLRTRAFESLSRKRGPGGMDGNDVVVRIYGNWRKDPAAFEKVYVEAENCSIGIDSNEIDANSVVVVVADDQYEPAVKKALGNSVLAQPYVKGVRLSLCRGGGEDQQWLTFRDAVGNPVVQGSVEIYLRAYKGAKVMLARATLDTSGRLKALTAQGPIRQLSFLFRHPDYGITEIDRSFRNETTIEVPIALRTNRAFERGIWGYIVDPEGRPVSGARIRCSHVRTLGEGLISAKNDGCEVIGDERGYFSLYMPNTRRPDERGYLIPPKSKYHVRIEAPRQLGLLPYAEPIENGREAIIVLKRGELFRRFVFEDRGGRITDPKRLELINIRVKQPGGSVLTLRYSDWKDGGIFAAGTYQAIMYGGGGQCEFKEVELNARSPEEVVFRLAEGVVYHGIVVHGLTGEPMPGAFVIGVMAIAKGNLSQITAGQWASMHELPQNPAADDEALKAVRKIYKFEKIARTDENGRFVMAFEPSEGFYGFVAFEENYLALMRRKHALQVDRDRNAQVPAMKLYPAAKVVVEPLAKVKRISICPRWVIDEQNNAPWVKDFLATDDRRESLFQYDKWLTPNKVQTFNVPAGLNLRVKLDAPYDSQWCPIAIDRTINLMQGEMLDLGSHSFEPALKVAVTVVNSAGELLEGVPVRVQHGDNGWGIAHNSDEQGISRFYVVPYAKGVFGVIHHGEGGVFLRESIPYQVGGKEDEGRRFTIQLSDEMVYQLFK